MIGLLRNYLRPYQRMVGITLVLLFIGAMGNLYLPDLFGDIINNGVAKGDTAYILRVGGLMLLVTAVLAVTSVIAVYYSARIAMGFGRDVRSAIFSKVETFSPGRGQHLRHGVPHHPQHERRDPGPDGRVRRPDHHRVGPDPDHRRDHHGPPD